MEGFLMSEMYRLEIHWEKALYNNEGICELNNAYFSGPVLNKAAKIKDNDNIMLDFFSQYISLAKSVYVGKLSWGEVVYSENKVFIKDAILTHESELNRVPQLKNDDYLVIDTANHEGHLHYTFPTYKTYVITAGDDLYNFNK